MASNSTSEKSDGVTARTLNKPLKIEIGRHVDNACSTDVQSAVLCYTGNVSVSCFSQSQMKRQDFLSAMDNLLELPTGTLKGPENLDELENWNSLAMVEYIALVDSNTSAKTSPRQIRDCDTIDDLARLAKIE